jgi:hypothetical protein
MMWLDAYERRCRLAPGLLALIPVAVLITALGMRRAPVVSGVLSILCLVGGPVLLASFVRSRGHAAQDQLWRNWGGSATTRALRLREPATNAVRRDAWRLAVESVTKVGLLSRTEEVADPSRADDTIDVAVDQLRERTRTETFPLVAAENRNYGFERNFYGMKATARLVAVMSAIVLGALTAVRIVSGIHPAAPTAYVLGAVIVAIVLVGWLALPSERRTRTTADKYAHQLLQAAVTLSDTTELPDNTKSRAGASASLSRRPSLAATRITPGVVDL